MGLYVDFVFNIMCIPILGMLFNELMLLDNKDDETRCLYEFEYVSFSIKFFFCCLNVIMISMAMYEVRRCKGYFIVPYMIIIYLYVATNLVHHIYQLQEGQCLIDRARESVIGTIYLSTAFYSELS